ncbi:hypothetical protein Vi05172_g7369 [Venturia inaequalis]|nr:hypothetical protein Vi05172_g7369 [Venturia inaequalis]
MAVDDSKSSSFAPTYSNSATIGPIPMPWEARDGTGVATISGCFVLPGTSVIRVAAAAFHIVPGGYLNLWKLGGGEAVVC